MMGRSRGKTSFLWLGDQLKEKRRERKARNWPKSSEDKVSACSKTLGVRVKTMGCLPSHSVNRCQLGLPEP